MTQLIIDPISSPLCCETLCAPGHAETHAMQKRILHRHRVNAVLEMNDRLLTGLKFGKIISNPTFYNSGIINASFHAPANEPLCRDRLMM